MPYKHLSARSRGVIFFMAGLIAAVGIVGSLYLRAVTLDKRDEVICTKVDRVVVAVSALASAGSVPPMPGQYGYAYWQAHPEEQKARGNVQDAVDAFVQAAACDPNNIHGGG
jgi:hypothetical protein